MRKKCRTTGFESAALPQAFALVVFRPMSIQTITPNLPAPLVGDSVICGVVVADVGGLDALSVVNFAKQ